MHTFKDSKGNVWDVTINVGVARRMKSIGHDLMNFEDFTNNFADIYKTVDFIYLLCQRQADEKSISDEAFGELLGSVDVVDEAIDKVIQAYGDFFPKLKPALAKMMESTNSAQNKAGQILTDAMAKITPEAILAHAGIESTNAPQSLE